MLWQEQAIENKGNAEQSIALLEFASFGALWHCKASP